MSALGIFVITTAIAATPVDNTGSALAALGKAAYIEADIDKYAKQLEKKYLNKQLQEYAGWIALAGKTVRDQKVSLEWKF